MTTHIRGDANEISVGATQGVGIQVGEPVAYVSGTQVSGLNRVTPWSQWPFDTDVEQTHVNFSRSFVGVSRDQKLSGDFRNISVATEGVHRFACGALGSGLNVGTLVGMVSGSATSVQVTASGAAAAIGTLAAPAMLGATTVDVAIAGRVSTPYWGPNSGVNAFA